MMDITFQINPKISVYDLIDVLEKSTLGLRRPLQDVAAMELMLIHANVYIGAYDGTKLVGLARAMTDYVIRPIWRIWRWMRRINIMESGKNSSKN